MSNRCLVSSIKMLKTVHQRCVMRMRVSPIDVYVDDHLLLLFLLLLLFGSNKRAMTRNTQQDPSMSLAWQPSVKDATDPYARLGKRETVRTNPDCPPYHPLPETLEDANHSTIIRGITGRQWTLPKTTQFNSNKDIKRWLCQQPELQGMSTYLGPRWKMNSNFRDL